MKVRALGTAPANITAWAVIVCLVVLACVQAVALQRVKADHLLLTASVVLATYAGYLLWREYHRHELISPLALYSFLLILHFAIPGLLITFGLVYFVDNDNLATAAEAQIFVLLGFVLFHLGYVAVSRSTRRGGIRNGRPPVPWRSSYVTLVVLVFLAFGWLDRAYIVSHDAYFQISRTALLNPSYHAAIRLGEQLPGYAMLIVWIWFWSKRGRRFGGLWWSGFAVWVAELVYWMPTGRKENVILTLLLPIIIRYVFTRRLPSLRVAIATAVFIVALFPAAYYYRFAMELGRPHTVTETIFDSANAIKELSAGDVPQPLSVIVSRLSLLESVGASLRIIGSDIWKPFAGQTYAWAVYSVIPRALWADKPDFHYGTEFGHAAGILSETDQQTSISVTYFGEAYLNFMWLGVLVMFFIGIIFGFIYKRMSQSRSQTTWILLYTVTLPVILYVGGSFALRFSGLFQLLVILGMVGHFMSGTFTMPRNNKQDEIA